MSYVFLWLFIVIMSYVFLWLLYAYATSNSIPQLRMDNCNPSP